MPHLKKAAEKYSNRLTVFALSLDETTERWKKAIRNLELEIFTHVFLGFDNPTSDSIKAHFGVTAIPANFLLDKDRRIIATDLRGDALEKKMQELTGK